MKKGLEGQMTVNDRCPDDNDNNNELYESIVF